MVIPEQIKEFVKRNGPVLPVQIAKEINSNTIIASAHLSESVANKELRISHIKVGTSPLYYLPGQEASLQKFSNHLHEKERKAYELLKNKEILRNNKLEPVIRVALKNINDFAVPLQVNYKENSEIFWRWYLLSNQEAEKLIKAELEEKPVPRKAEPQGAEEQKELVKKIMPGEVQKETKETQKEPAEPLLKLINNYFHQNKIKIINERTIRKNSEAEFIIELPSTVGQLTYYCRAKTKKKINEGDLSAVFITGQSKKLPVLLLTKGELTKKAKKMLEKEFKGMSVKKI